MFANCKNLKLIIFGKESQLEEIQSKAFYNSGLKSFTAPSSLKAIGASAFCNCNNLRHVDLSKCQLQIDDKEDCEESSWLNHIVNVTNLESIALPPTLQVIREG